MTFNKKKITQQTNLYNVTRLKTLVKLKNLNLAEFVNWNYQRFSTESFSNEGSGCAVGYCMVLFLMQQEDTSFQIFRNLIGGHSTVEILNKCYSGGFAHFEKDFF
jgi:hypothetical protein